MKALKISAIVIGSAVVLMIIIYQYDRYPDNRRPVSRDRNNEVVTAAP